MWKTLACALLAAAGIAALPGTARAQPSAADVRLAEDLAQQAFAAHGRREYYLAIFQYQKAYQLSSFAIILFNLANIYDRKIGDREQALDYYQRYLRSNEPEPEPELVKRASERIDSIRAEIEAARLSHAKERSPPRSAAPSRSTVTTATALAATSPSAPLPPVAEHGPSLRTAGVAVAAVGLGGLVLGGVYGFRAKSKNDQASMICNGSVCPDQRGVTLTDDANRAARVSTAGFLLGGMLVAAGVGIFVCAPPRRGGRVNRTGVRITPQLGGFAISGTWP